LSLIASCVEKLFSKALIQRCVVALVVWLSLLFALSPQAAYARIHNYHASSGRLHQASSMQTHRARGYAHARPHRVWAASPTRWRRVASVAYRRSRGFRVAAVARTHRTKVYASARRNLVRFARSMPAMPVHSLSAKGSSVIADALRFVGAGNVTGMPGPWCADYASMILRRTGHKALAGRSVSAALAYGPRVRQPRPGDLVVINTRAGYAQHVGFFAGWSHGLMEMISGNWGHRVSVAPISPRSVAAFIGV
jgi:uncharacterized protein (TIGR02594 family)